MFYTKDPNGLFFFWEDSQELIIPENHIKVTDEEVNPPSPPVTMEHVKQKLQEYCERIAVAMVGDYKNSTEVLVYASIGDTKAKEFSDWYNTVWDLKTSLTDAPHDIDAWIESLPKFKEVTTT